MSGVSIGSGVVASDISTAPSGRWKLVAGRAQVNGQNTDSAGTNTTVQAKLAIKPTPPQNFSSPRLLFTHWGVAGATANEYNPNPSGNLTVSASLLFNSNYFQATFSGNSQGTIAPGASLLSDPIPCDYSTAFQLYVNWFLSTSATNKWARGQQVIPALGDLFAEGVGLSDLTMSGTITNTQGAEYGFSGLLGLTSSPQLAIAGLGDSIMWGQGDDATGLLAPAGTNGNGQGYWGWLGRACYAINVPFLQMARAGDQASFNQTPYAKRKNLIVQSPTGPIVDYVIVALGANDATNGRTYAQLKSDLTTIIADYKRRGVGVVICTITPKTTSTDSWATVGNQTSATNHTLTDAPALVNADLRAGNLYGANRMFDVAAEVESAFGSGIWKAGYTNDGLHGNPTSYGAVATAASTWINANLVAN